MPEEHDAIRGTSLTRRSAVRATAWAVPAVTIVAAAPAYATSHGVPTISSVTADYELGTPEFLNVNAVIDDGVGSGLQTAATYTLTLTIPGGLYDSVQSSTATASPITGSLAAGWTLLFNVGPGGFYTALQLGGTTLATLFRGYRGESFTLGATLSATGHPSDAKSAPVLAVGASTISSDAAGSVTTSLDDTGTAIVGVGLAGTDVGIVPEDHSAVGRLRVAVALDALPGGVAPVVQSVGAGWEVDDELPLPIYEQGEWIVRFVTTQAAHTARNNQPLERGPAGFAFSAEVGTVGSLITPGGVATFYFTTDETDFGWDVNDSKARRVIDDAPIPPLPSP